MSQRVSSAGPTAESAHEVLVDRSALSIGMLGFGAAGMRVVRRWIEQVPPGTAVSWAAAQRADALSLAELERAVRTARPGGWRLMLAGPEADVSAAREAALRLGVPETDVRAVVTAREPRRVWCTGSWWRTTPASKLRR